jgi:hypothetical protein
MTGTNQIPMDDYMKDITVEVEMATVEEAADILTQLPVSSSHLVPMTNEPLLAIDYPPLQRLRR